MSVIREVSNGFLISHKLFIDNIYGTVKKKESTECYTLNSKLFDISTPFKTPPEPNGVRKNTNRKRKHGAIEADSECATVEKLFYEAIAGLQNEPPANKIGNTSAKDFAEEVLLASSGLHISKSNGGNNSENAILCLINGQEILIPPTCRFYSGCVKEILPTLSERFNLVILDPPWWNKYIRRVKAKAPNKCYSMMYNSEIALLPIENLLSPNAIIAVWCTNCQNHIDAIKTDIFPAWGVKYVASWYWVKTTTNFEPVCPFGSSASKRPYERILFGMMGKIPDGLTDGKILISVPSAIHSHKPPLIDILKTYLLPEEPKCLEIFARYLLPNTTSVGNEPLRLQHISAYEIST